ncbi:MAG: hypothetical protein AB7L09_01500 [Nitrospira sp.]
MIMFLTKSIHDPVKRVNGTQIRPATNGTLTGLDDSLLDEVVNVSPHKRASSVGYDRRELWTLDDVVDHVRSSARRRISAEYAL